MQIKKRNGFTLAETLITLAIIGIVAAMTIPALINKFKEIVTVTKLKKFYSILSQSYLYAVQEYGEISTWGLDRDQENAVLLRNRLFVNAQISKICDDAKDLSECGITEIYDLKGSSKDTGASSLSCGLVLADGSSALVMANEPGDSRGSGALSETYGLVYLITNPYKKTLYYGKDVFMFTVTKQDITPEGTINDTTNPFETSCSSKGRGCAAWVIYNENMDYLKCSDLAWGVKNKCD